MCGTPFPAFFDNNQSGDYMPETFLIHTQAPGGATQYARMGFDGVPVVSPCLVTIVSDGSAQGLGYAGELAAELREALVTSSPAAAAKDLSNMRMSDPTAIPEFQEPGRSNLIVLVGGGSLPFPYEPWYANGRVLPVLPKNASATQVFPKPPFGAIREINVRFWSDAVSEAVPAVFSLIGLTTDSQRIFISYRRIETQPLALQLFDALTHEGLDVFLDRFSIPPGLNFQQRLYQELAEKSMVLLLESERLSSSAWTQIEIDHCKKYRLGLFSLQMPQVPRERAIGSIGIDLRKTLSVTDFAGPPLMMNNPLYTGIPNDPEPPLVTQWQTLTDQALGEVVFEIRKVHDQALFRRRRYLREVMDKALKNAGAANVTFDDAGMLVVSGGLGKRYSIWLTTRPPELPDFQVTHIRAAIPPANRGIVIGPLVLLEPACQKRLDWLSSVSMMKCVDESQIATAAAEVVKGTL
jgi:hypothetical protein